MSNRNFDRVQFASALRSVADNYSTDQVLSLIGPPDDVRTQVDGDAGLLHESTEMWCYGANQHLGFPTLGHVYFNSSRLVHHHNPTTLPDVAVQQLFYELELRQLLCLIDQLPPPQDSYHPRILVQIANQFHLLGKAKVTAAIAEYLRVAPILAPARSGLFLLLRVLFDFPMKSHLIPQVVLGEPFPPRTTEERASVRYPIAVYGDVPLLLLIGYRLRGAPDRVERHLDFYKTDCSLRVAPLKPTDEPFGIIDMIERASSDRWIASDPYLRGWLISQLLRLVDSVYKPNSPDSFLGMNVLEQNQWLKRFESEFESFGFQWDGKLNDYNKSTPKS